MCVCVLVCLHVCVCVYACACVHKTQPFPQGQFNLWSWSALWLDLLPAFLDLQHVLKLFVKLLSLLRLLQTQVDLLQLEGELLHLALQCLRGLEETQDLHLVLLGELGWGGEGRKEQTNNRRREDGQPWHLRVREPPSPQTCTNLGFAAEGGSTAAAAVGLWPAAVLSPLAAARSSGAAVGEPPGLAAEAEPIAMATTGVGGGEGRGRYQLVAKALVKAPVNIDF